MKLKEQTPAERKAWKAGVRAAAGVAADYDYLSSHVYLVSDCILGKLNVGSRSRPRKNRRRADGKGAAT